MGRDKRGLPSAATGGPKERHRRQQRSQYDPYAPVPEGFVAKPAVPKSKHHTYFEFVENKNKKKKLEFQITTKKEPPPGFEFVPIGNPELTTACKEISRERDAMIFIVSNATRDAEPTHLAGQIHRMGHHIRETIVEEARAALSQFPISTSASVSNGEPEPIPESQQEYHAQVDPAIRDLFPRIPNTDRQMVIAHSFTRGASLRDEKEPVGLCDTITLARRVQLAVLAHIRHEHTRYDDLLKETTWQNARKVVESLCLDTLVKWRGDEETGRDQLDEILREVIIISDSEPEDSGAESTDDTSLEEADASPEAVTGPIPTRVLRPAQTEHRNRAALPIASRRPMPFPMITTVPATGEPSSVQRRERNQQRGFKRYRAWEEAIRRHRERELQQPSEAVNAGIARLQIQPGGRPEQALPSEPTMHPVSNSMMPPGLRPHHRAEDVPVPSIEPAPPQTMQPYFVRTIAPRIPLEAHSHLRRRAEAYPENHPEPGISSPYHPPLPGGQQRPVSVQDMTRHVDVASHGQEPPSQSFQPYNQRQVYLDPEASQTSSSVRRIVVDAPRPGTRSNPIVMEDRGGFYERVMVPQDSLNSHGPHTGSSSVPLIPVSRMPPVAPPRPEGPVIYEERRMLRPDYVPPSHDRGMPHYSNHLQASAYQDGPQPTWDPALRLQNPDQTQPNGQPHVYTEYLPSREEVRYSRWVPEGDRMAYQQTHPYDARQPGYGPSRRNDSRNAQHGDVIILD